MNRITISLELHFYFEGVEFLSLVLQRSPPETMNRQSGVFFGSSSWIPWTETPEYKFEFSQSFIAKNWTIRRL